MSRGTAEAQRARRMEDEGLTVTLTPRDQRLMAGMSDAARVRYIQQKADRTKARGKS